MVLHCKHPLNQSFLVAAMNSFDFGYTSVKIDRKEESLYDTKPNRVLETAGNSQS